MSIRSTIFTPQTKPSCKVRLICFPYAGGGVATYLEWRNHLLKDVELNLVQLPGRGSRITEAPIDDIQSLAKLCAAELLEMSKVPMVFFGHSFGAMVAYETMRYLEASAHRLPAAFIASACASPFHQRTDLPKSGADDQCFIAKLREIGGTPDAILSDKEMMQLILPAIRADFNMLENYQNKLSSKLPVPVQVFHGNQDDVKEEELLRWFSLFNKDLGLEVFDGDHFFVDTLTIDVVSRVNKLILDNGIIAD